MTGVGEEAKRRNGVMSDAGLPTQPDRATGQEHEAALRAYFRRRADPADIDDLIQQTFLALQARKSEEAIANQQAYLFAVASNVLKRYRLSASRLRSHRALLSSLPPEVDQISPERQAIDRDRLNQAMTIIDRMPQRTRDIFLLHRFESMTYSEIGRQHAISVSAVEKHIMAALRALLHGLDDE